MPDATHNYRLVHDQNMDALEGEVDRLVDDGWVPLGNIVVTSFKRYGSTDPHGLYFTQALVKQRS